MKDYVAPVINVFYCRTDVITASNLADQDSLIDLLNSKDTDTVWGGSW